MNKEKMQQLKCGSIVVLNSGGTPMTVTAWEDDRLDIAEAAKTPFGADEALLLAVPPESLCVHCVWHNAGGGIERGSYPAACLRLQGASSVTTAAV